MNLQKTEKISGTICFKGDVVPKMVILNDDSKILHFKFDSDTNRGDSVKFSQALSEDYDLPLNFSERSPQRLFLDNKCLFDSIDSDMFVYSDNDSDKVLLSIITGEMDQEDMFIGNSTKSNKKITQVVKEFMDKMIINTDNNLHPELDKDQFFDTAIEILKKMKKAK